MKKIAFFLASLAICACGKKAADVSETEVAEANTVDTLVYAGMLPAADCDGIAYEVMLVNDSLNSCVSISEYQGVVETSTCTFEDKGTYSVFEQDGKSYYKLTFEDGNEQYFLKLDEQTLRMVNQELEEPQLVEGMNYDLKMK